MNSTNTTSGGYDSTEMHKTNLPEILALMPSEVQNGIKQVNKKATAGGGSKTIETIPCKLFLLSEVEIFGKVTYSAAGEGSQYAYYSSGNSKLKKLNGTAISWWERSPNVNDPIAFGCVNTSGNAWNYDASEARGMAFAFCF